MTTVEDIRIPEDQEPTEDRNVLRVLDHTGDTRFGWDPNNPGEVAAAEEHFKAMKEKRYMAYKVTERGGKGELIREFDPAAREVIMSPQTVGG